MSEIETLGEKLLEECARVRELVGIYKETAEMFPRAMVGPAIAMMEATLRQADQAMVAGDLMRMIAAYQALHGFTE